MSAAGRPIRLAGHIARLAGVALLWSCADLLHEPAPDTARPLAIRFTEGPTQERASIAAAGADAARITVERASEDSPEEMVVDTLLPLPTDGETVRLRLALSGSLVGASLRVGVELLAGSAAVFRGSATATVRESGTTVVDLPLQPIVAAVRVEADPPTLTALGDALDLTGEALFASGEVVPGVTLSWRALDGGVVEVNGAGRATAIGEGEARVEGSYDGQADTVRLVVAQVASALEVEPENATLRPDQQLTFTATARDANGEVAAGRSPTWSSSSTSVVTVDPATGQARGRGAGTAQVTATLGELQAVASVTVENPGPAISQLSPSSATAGGSGFELSVSGSGFVSGSTVRWNGTPRQTRQVSASELRATIPAGDIASPGVASVTVANPAPGGGTSAAAQFQVIAAPALAVEPTSLAFDMDRGGSAPQARTLRVTNTGGGSLGILRPEVRYLSGTGWLSVAPATASAPANFTATVDGAALAAGEYSATILISADGSGATVEVPVTLLVRSVAPAPPSGLTAIRTGLTADLTWTDNSDNETGFRVERRVGEGNWAMLAETAANVQSYHDSALTRGERYSYRVRAFSSAGASDPTNEVQVVVDDAPHVETSAASAVGAGTATLNGVTNGNGLDHEAWFVWREVGGSSRETTRRSSAPDCTADEACSWSWTLGNLYGGRSYEYWLEAESSGGRESGDTVRFETAAAVAPTVEALSEQLVGLNGVRLEYRVTPRGHDFVTWVEIGRRADMQEVDGRTEEQQQTLSSRIGSTDPWSFTQVMTGLSWLTTYYWRAASRGPSGEVIYSETRRFESFLGTPGGGGGDDGDDDDDDDDDDDGDDS